MDRTCVTIVALAANGDMVGHTQLVRPASDPVNAVQWDTLVTPAHRGHRLGLALKAINHLHFQEIFPEPQCIHTWNARDNTPMVAINDALGFRPVELYGEWQGPVPG